MEEMPIPIWSGTFTVCGVDVECHTLSDGRRIIEADSMAALLEAMADPENIMSPEGVEEFARWQAGLSAGGQ